METLHQSIFDIGHTARLKIYADGSKELLVASAPIFKEKGWELEKNSCADGENNSAKNDDENLSRALRRARIAVNDIARSTEFSYFVTLTLDKDKVDRYDASAIVKKLNTWLDNNVRRRGLTYVLIPEHHKDGAIHFHGFFNDALPVVSSGHYDRNGHEIFNLPRWIYGFSTAISLYGDYRSAVGYVCKYISKQSEKIGGRWYYSGGDIKKPTIELLDVDFSDVSDSGAYSFDVPEIGVRFLKIELNND